jgi:hypothetical protein
VIAYEKCMFFTWKKSPHEQIVKLLGIFATGENLFLFSSNTKKHQAPNCCTQQELNPYPLIERFRDLYILEPAARRVSVINI